MTNRNMMCDLQTGICGVAGEDDMEIIDFSQPAKTVNVYYVTDPICSHCWALEPVLRRFQEQYGHYFNFHTVLGGLLEKWHDGPIDPANGIYKPADVAPHWREVGQHSRMPIDGSVMLDNPVQSSFPASRVLKIIDNNHGADKASQYLRRTREQLFPFNQNVSALDVLANIVDVMGLDGKAIVEEAESPIGHELLNEDFALARKLGARGFPTIIMINEANKGVKIVGSRPLDIYVQGLQQVLGKELQPKELPSLTSLLEKEELLFSKEIEEMYDLDQASVTNFLKENLATDAYTFKEILGENYIIKK